MIRFALAISVLALSACAQPPAPPTPQAVAAIGVYQDLQVKQVQRQMSYYNTVLTYGNAVVSCGIRSPEWYTQLQGVYAYQYGLELQRVPLNPSQQAAVLAHSTAEVQNPSPPPYICFRLQQDPLLVSLDQAVAEHSFMVATAK
jgi:hypothetical protein